MNEAGNNVGQFGVHLMIDGYGAPEAALADEASLRALLTELPAKMGMHPICEPVLVSVGPNNKKDPGGLSGFVMIAESHISFHTFPARGFVSIDVYTCQNELDEAKFIEEFSNVFRFTDCDTHCISRGVRYPLQDRVAED